MQEISFDERGLVPCIVQDWRTGEVLTLAYMNEQALERTRATGETHFWSRSRGELWHKGETSGNVQRVRELRFDCDLDAVLERTVASRRAERPEGSYTAELLADPARLGDKVREEADEAARAAAGESDRRVEEEAADVLYHLTVLLASRDLSLADAFEELNARRR